MRGAPIDDREQRYAYVGAGLGAMVSVALWAPAFDEAAGLALAGIGVVMSGLLALAARRPSRLLTGGAAVLLSFGPWGFAWIVGLPYLVLAGWLVLRAPRPEPREPREPRTSRRRRDADEVEQPQPAPPAPSGPPKPNKRYTPPRGRL